MSTSVVQHASLPARQLDMFDAGSGLQRFGVATCTEVESALGRADCAAALSVSGGKDSQALAYRVFEHLDQIGFAGPRVLVHSDLGRVEWRDSMPVCERVALRLGAELIVVRRQAGDMMDRWLSRWQGNVHRYRALSCVKLILPWSTAQSRFCTSELKAAPIASALRKRFPTGTLVTAIGLRRDESRARALAPIWRPDNRTTRVRGAGLAWHPLSAWSRQEVIDYIRLRGDVLHEAYRIYGSTRVSCSFCILASEHDLRAATRCEANAAIYREMVELEISSTFAFQANRWLGDMAPALLDAPTRARLREAKGRAAERSAAEGLLPDRLLFVKGWPTVMPSAEEAGLIAHVRRRVAAAVGLEVDCTDAASVLDRYRHLMDRRSSLAPETPTRIAKRPNKVARDTGAAPTPGAPPSIGLRQVAAHAAATSQPSQAPVPDRARKRWRAAAIRCAVAWDAAAMTVAALDMREANEYATRLGRRLGALHGDRFALAIEQTGAGQVKGLAVCARPGDRRLDDALTLVIECFSTESACAPVDGLLMRSIAVEASRRGYRRLLVRGGPGGQRCMGDNGTLRVATCGGHKSSAQRFISADSTPLAVARSRETPRRLSGLSERVQRRTTG